jgi:hypothetical protein
MLDILLQQNIFSYKKEEKITSFIQPYGSNHVEVTAVSKLVTTTYCWSHYNLHLMASRLAPATDVAGRS